MEAAVVPGIFIARSVPFSANKGAGLLTNGAFG